MTRLKPVPHHLQQLLRVLYRVLTVRDAEVLVEVADMRPMVVAATASSPAICSLLWPE